MNNKVNKAEDNPVKPKNWKLMQTHRDTKAMARAKSPLPFAREIGKD
jgi:hypothetical protein